MGQTDDPVKDAAPAASDAAKPDTSKLDAAASEPLKVEAKAAEKTHAPRRTLRERFAPLAAPLAARPKLSRAAVLAAAIALSAAAGSVVGAMAAASFSKPQLPFPDDGRSIEVNALRGVITQLSAEVASLKASIDSSAKSHNAQMSKLADRLEKAERAQAEPAARVAKLSDMLERIDRRTAAAPAPAPQQTAEVTGSVAPKQQDRPPVLNGWVLREVFRGRAMVDNERLGLFEVMPGANLPGLGRVEAIRREEGRWVVVTPKGIILSER